MLALPSCGRPLTLAHVNYRRIDGHGLAGNFWRVWQNIPLIYIKLYLSEPAGYLALTDLMRGLLAQKLGDIHLFRSGNEPKTPSRDREFCW
jgi:hypothetical protein